MKWVNGTDDTGNRFSTEQDIEAVFPWQGWIELYHITVTAGQGFNFKRQFFSEWINNRHVNRGQSSIFFFYYVKRWMI